MTATSTSGLVAFLIMWGIFTAILFVGSLTLNRATQFIFGSLTLLFALLAIGDATGIEWIKTFAGIEGIVCGASAIYAAAAQILNDMYGRELLPLGTLAAKSTTALKMAA
jgi:succinate-acetate transporter protein